MRHERFLLITAAVALVGGVLLVSLLLSGNQAPDKKPAPKPSATIGTGPLPTVQPTATPTPGDIDGEDPAPEPDEAHSHDEGPSDDCTGPVGCGDEDVSRNTPEDKVAAAAVRARVAPFVLEWTKIDSTETAAARTARLIAAGATPEAAKAVSVLARTHTHQTGLTVSTTPRAVQRVLFLARDGDLLKFQASLDVDATYMQPDDSGSVHVAGGAVYIYLTEQGAIAKVTDAFPTIESLR